MELFHNYQFSLVFFLPQCKSVAIYLTSQTIKNDYIAYKLLLQKHCLYIYIPVITDIPLTPSQHSGMAAYRLCTLA